MMASCSLSVFHRTQCFVNKHRIQPAELAGVGMLKLLYVTLDVGALQEFTSDITLLACWNFEYKSDFRCRGPKIRDITDVFLFLHGQYAVV